LLLSPPFLPFFIKAIRRRKSGITISREKKKTMPLVDKKETSCWKLEDIHKATITWRKPNGSTNGL
jgi:hypothetical protein